MTPRPAFRLSLAACMLALAAILPGVRADDFVDRVNAFYGTIRPERRSDLVLLPALSQMAPPPEAVSTPRQAMILPAGSAAWSAAEAWAAAPTQQAVIQALDRITAEEDPHEAMAFGQPYGVEALAISPEGIALIRAGLYTELGDPPMLAAARFQHLPALDRMACLVHVEATRRAAAGQVAESLDLLVDWVFFCRQMMDREFFREVRWAMTSMVGGLERLRDVMYVDFRSGSPGLTASRLAEVLDRIREEGGYLQIARNLLPRGDCIAAEQVVARTYVARGGPDPATFPTTMARLTSTEHPLRLFSESARWKTLIDLSADWLDTTEQLRRVCNDWETRWTLNYFDPILAVPSSHERLNRVRYAALDAALPDMGVLFTERQVIDAQLVGTRNALGLVAFYYNNRNFPLHLAAIRPTYIRDLGSDPFNSRSREVQGRPPLEFFVPIRDTRDRFGPRDTPRPHEINVFTPGGEFNFKTRVGEDQFVLYSVGPNGAKEWAENATGTPVRDSIGDLLLWPPAVSLYREELQRTGRLR